QESRASARGSWGGNGRRGPEPVAVMRLEPVKQHAIVALCVRASSAVDVIGAMNVASAAYDFELRIKALRESMIKINTFHLRNRVCEAVHANETEITSFN